MKRNRVFRLLASLTVVVLCMTAFSVTAFAGGGDGDYYTGEPAETTPEPVSYTHLVGQWDIPQAEQGRDDLEPVPVGGGVLSHPGGVGWIPLDFETIGFRSEEEGREPVGTDDCPGAAGIRHGGAKPGLGGMAHGIPPEMDGRILWHSEPEGVPRMTEDTDNRALRLKTLGNAVCPPQAYPIFQYIAMIETGACADICPYGTGGDAP